ncbi:MAG: hypothetical protein RQ899_10965 [Pseudomonadales bacterium]|nr:hypothetical protein [Pseudomonadales bacterium]
MSLHYPEGGVKSGLIKSFPDMTLNERQRQDYLRTMGITAYYPRFVLPAARASKQCDWPEALPPKEEIEEVIETGEKGAAPLPAVTARQGRTQAAMSSSSDERAGLIGPDDKPAGSTEEIRFQLGFIRVNASLCILNQLPYMGRPQLPPAHQRLLINILKSRQFDCQAMDFGELPFRWPFGEGQHLEKNALAAKAALLAYLEQKMSEQAFATLLLMGEMAERFVVPESGADSEQPGWRLVVTRSLHEIISVPALKKTVWRDLQALSLRR